MQFITSQNIGTGRFWSNAVTIFPQWSEGPRKSWRNIKQ